MGDRVHRRRRAVILGALVALTGLGAVGSAPAAAQSTACPYGELTLSGGTSPDETIGVDDDLEVRLNDTTPPLFVDDNEFATENDPIEFTAAQGDKLRVIASNSTIFGANAQIEPLYLHCDATGAYQVLDADGFGPTSAAHGAVFYDETFTIEFFVPQCSDRIDNDGDSRVDHPNDPGCESLTDNSEADPPPAARPAPTASPPAPTPSQPPPPPPPARDAAAPIATMAGVRRTCVARTFAMRVTARDPGGTVAWVLVSLDGRRIATTSRADFRLQVPVRRLRAGTHTLRVTAIDAAGNRRTATRRFTRCLVRRVQRPRFTG